MAIAKSAEVEAGEEAFADIVNAFANSETEKAVTLSTGRVVRIRMPNSMSQINRIKTEAKKYAQMFAGQLPLPARLSKFNGLDTETQTLCVIAAQMVIDPVLTLSQWLELSEKAGRFLMEIGPAVSEAFLGLDTLYTQSEITEEGNASGVTPGTAPDA